MTPGACHRFTVYEDPSYYCGPGPTVVVGGDGRITVAFRRVPSWLDEGLVSHWHPATELCLTHSGDGGASWSSPQVFLGGYQCPNLRRLRDGTLVHHTHRLELVTEAILAGSQAPPGRTGSSYWPGLPRGTAVWRSTDGGITWGDPVYLSGVPGVEPLYPRLGAPLAVRGNVLETASGRLLVSAYTLGQDSTSHVFGSDDGGCSWSWLAPIARDANETFLYQTEAGELVAFLRRHLCPEVLSSCRSRDGGATWSAPEPMCRGFPACALRMPSGRVLLVYGFRFAEGYGVRARLLSPACAPRPDAPELVLGDDGAGPDLGYPDAALLPDGRALVVYYHNARQDPGRDDAASRAPRYVEGCLVEAG